MAWLWWLLAPVLSTVAGAVVLTLRGRTESSRQHDSIGDHQALLAALARHQADHPVPATMRLLDDRAAASPE